MDIESDRQVAAEKEKYQQNSVEEEITSRKSEVCNGLTESVVVPSPGYAVEI